MKPATPMPRERNRTWIVLNNREDKALGLFRSFEEAWKAARRYVGGKTHTRRGLSFGYIVAGDRRLATIVPVNWHNRAPRRW
jgi:hypothetical protein